MSPTYVLTLVDTLLLKSWYYFVDVTITFSISIDCPIEATCYYWQSETYIAFESSRYVFVPNNYSIYVISSKKSEIVIIKVVSHEYISN